MPARRLILACTLCLAVATAALAISPPTSAQGLLFQRGPVADAPGFEIRDSWRFGRRFGGTRPHWPEPADRWRVRHDSSRAVFRVAYENHAWVFTRASCEIRDDGRILLARYSSPPHRIVGYEEIGQLPAHEVRRMAALIPAASGYGMTEPRHVMADFGSIALTGLGRGRPVTLKIWGDTVSVNRSPVAARLITWAAGAFPDACPS